MRGGADERRNLARAIRTEFIARLELLGEANHRAGLAHWLGVLVRGSSRALPEQPKALTKRLRPVVDGFARRARRASSGPGSSQKHGHKHERAAWDAWADEFTQLVLGALALTAAEINAAMSWRRQQVRRQARRPTEAAVPEFLVAIGRAEKSARAKRSRQK